MSRKIHWISRPEQLCVLQNTVRHDILDRLTALGPSPVRSIAAALGVQPTAIYRHLRLLERAGLVVAIKKTGSRGRPANTYRAIAPLVRFARAPLESENRPIMANIVKSVAGRAAREYRDALTDSDTRIEGPRRNFWFLRLQTAPSAKKLARINQLLDEVAELIWTPDPTPGPVLHVTWIISPSSSSEKRRTASK
ncbi:MAG TPA: helix-turn-helix domain-containing protein [Rhizomicrobium sp.]